MMFLKHQLKSPLAVIIFTLAMLLVSTSITKADHHQPLKSASELDYPPFSIVNKNNQATGFSVELLKATSKAMERKIEFKVAPWSQIKQELTDNKLDVLPLVGRTPDREAIFDFTIPYLTLTDPHEIHS